MFSQKFLLASIRVIRRLHIRAIRNAIDESSRSSPQDELAVASLRKFFAGEEYVLTQDTKDLMVPVSRFFSRHFVYLVGKLSDSCRSTPPLNIGIFPRSKSNCRSRLPRSPNSVGSVRSHCLQLRRGWDPSVKIFNELKKS
jgi:hypothetical protein